MSDCTSLRMLSRHGVAQWWESFVWTKHQAGFCKVMPVCTCIHSASCVLCILADSMWLAAAGSNHYSRATEKKKKRKHQQDTAEKPADITLDGLAGLPSNHARPTGTASNTPNATTDGKLAGLCAMTNVAEQETQEQVSELRCRAALGQCTQTQTVTAAPHTIRLMWCGVDCTCACWDQVASSEASPAARTFAAVSVSFTYLQLKPAGSTSILLMILLHMSSLSYRRDLH